MPSAATPTPGSGRLPRSSIGYAVLVALPGLVLAVVACFHPIHLNYSTSQRWYQVHVGGLAVMPLVGVALAGLVRGRRDPVSWLVRLTAYGFASFYTALDVLSGIGTAYVLHSGGPDAPRPVAVHYLFRIGTPLGRIGSVSLMICALLLLLDAVVDVRWAGLGGLLLLWGAYLVHEHHIFPPEGVEGLVLIAVGSAALVLGRAWAGVPIGSRRSSDPVAATDRVSTTS